MGGEKPSKQASSSGSTHGCPHVGAALAPPQSTIWLLQQYLPTLGSDTLPQPEPPHWEQPAEQQYQP